MNEDSNSPAHTTIRLTFRWLVVIFFLIVLFGVLGGFIAQQFFRQPIPFQSNGQQLITTVQQVTVSPTKQRAVVADQLSKSVVIIAQQSSTGIKSLGVGTIVTNDGYVVTLQSVLSGTKQSETEKLIIIDNQNRVSRVQVVGDDATYGLTYLKITSAVAVPVELSSDSLPVGSVFIGVGRSLQSGVASVSSFEMQQAIVPGRDLAAPAWQQIGQGIFTDRTILPGTPLASEDGKVVALTLNPDNGSVLPAHYIQDSLNRVTSSKREYNPFEAAGFTVKYDLAISLNGTSPYIFTATVASVTPGSPAALSGIKVQDIITKIGEEDVVWGRDVATLLAKPLPLPLTITRSGATQVISLSEKPTPSP